ncbi:hypothetical protein NSPZN2_30014 [Nitrospira defluvii]|uniref:Uncharacterized protein n=1 Tax=Nitrospira defluvii TaxID=330214 RepID=A0ABM8RDU8_9BACT|nr:hypothetical protein NSPZN2_30014 [Nitrospira defluvii]
MDMERSGSYRSWRWQRAMQSESGQGGCHEAKQNVVCGAAGPTHAGGVRDCHSSKPAGSVCRDDSDC